MIFHYIYNVYMRFMNDVVFSKIKTAYETRIHAEPAWYLTADTTFSICTNSRTPAASAVHSVPPLIGLPARQS